MIDGRDQDRVHQTPDGGRRQFAGQNQVNRRAKRSASHQFCDVVSADRDTVRLNPRYGSIPDGVLVGFTHKTLSFHFFKISTTASGNSPNASTTVAPASRNAFTLPACVPRPPSMIAPDRKS